MMRHAGMGKGVQAQKTAMGKARGGVCLINSEQASVAEEQRARGKVKGRKIREDMCRTRVWL